MSRLSPAIFFDRDGVINALVGDGVLRGPRKFGELQVDSACESVTSQLQSMGYKIFIVTNQPDISRGLLSEEDNSRIKLKILNKLPAISAYYTCPHDNFHRCECRKPKNGLIETAIIEHRIDRDSSYFVGDTWTDVAAGKMSLLKTILLERDYSYNATSQGFPPEDLEPNFRISNLEDVLRLV